ncbi:hypothetical protein N8083_01605 [Candidatus Pacebacteria bacterium]|nr:hypothetical protein [Candidatus Paceibacterota bacterium]
MVRLNKTPLTTEQIDKLFFQLAKVLSPRQEIRVTAVLNEILGREERIMIAKRLATIVLLSENLSSYKISRILKLSESTVATISKNLIRGEYKTILQTLGKNKKNYFAVLETIDNILHLGGVLPHYNGLDRDRGL